MSGFGSSSPSLRGPQGLCGSRAEAISSHNLQYDLRGDCVKRLLRRAPRTEALPLLAMTGMEAPASMTGMETPASLRGMETPASLRGMETPASLRGLKTLVALRQLTTDN